MTKVAGKGAAKPSLRPVVAPAFGVYLKGLREELRTKQPFWTMEYVARKIGTNLSTLSHIESGRTFAPDPLILRSLAALYNVSFDALLDLLHWSRRHEAATAPIDIPKVEDGMRIFGDEESLVRWMRDEHIEPTQARRYLEFQKGGALVGGATFRDAKKRRHK